MNCPQCGAGLMPGAKFCGACGATVAEVGAGAPRPAPAASPPQGGFNIDLGG